MSRVSRLTGELVELTDIDGGDPPDLAAIMSGMDELDAVLTELVEPAEMELPMAEPARY